MTVSAWLEAYEQLPEEIQGRVQRWLHLQKFISQTLKIPWEKWVEHYLGYCMEHPFDYSFMEATFPSFAGFDGPTGQGVSFSKEIDPATALVARVPLRAQNNMGKLSPDLQDALGGMLEVGDPSATRLLPADVVHLQKMFPKEKALAKLKRKDFRKLTIERDGDDVVVEVEGGDELLRLNVLEFSAVMSRALV